VQPFDQSEALVLGEHLLVRQLAPQAVVPLEHLARQFQRTFVADVEQLAVEVRLRELEVVRALALGELFVQLRGLRVDQVRRQLPGVAAKERVRERAVAPEEPGQVQAHEQLRERVEQERQRRREHSAREHEPVGERVLEVAGDQNRLVARAPLARHADGLDRRHPDLAERAQQPVLALRKARRQLLERVQRPLVVDEPHDMASEPTRDLDEPRRVPVLERLVPGQIEEIRVTGAGDEAEGHTVLLILPRVCAGQSQPDTRSPPRRVRGRSRAAGTPSMQSWRRASRRGSASRR
jgi:hypothetical protein